MTIFTIFILAKYLWAEQNSENIHAKAICRVPGSKSLQRCQRNVACI